MDFKNLFTSFNGRINRQPFWIGVLILIGINIVLNLVLSGIMQASEVGTASLVVGLILLYPALAVYTKRLHDRNKPWPWLLILLIPVVNLIWVIVDLGIMEGTKGDNQFGPDPLAGK